MMRFEQDVIAAKEHSGLWHLCHCDLKLACPMYHTKYIDILFTMHNAADSLSVSDHTL